MSNPAIEKYGWTAVPRKVETLLQQSEASGPAHPISVSSIKLPDSPLVKVVHEHAKKELAIETFNHSMRVYYYGNLLSDFPSKNLTELRRTSNPHPRLSLLVKPLFQRNLLPKLSPPRYRHH
jgi:hypothetical protein